jgi:pilus assembly protein CpaE
VQIAPVPRVSIQAFCESPEIAAVIQEAVSDRRMVKAHVKVHMGGALAAVEAYRSAPTPNVIVLESTMGDTNTLSDRNFGQGPLQINRPKPPSASRFLIAA